MEDLELGDFSDLFEDEEKAEEKVEEVVEEKETEVEEKETEVEEKDEDELVIDDTETKEIQETEEIKEEVKPKEEVKQPDKQSEAFKALRLEKEAKEKEAKEFEEKVAKFERERALLTKYFAGHLPEVNGDETKALKFIDDVVKKQYEEENGIPFEINEKLQDKDKTIQEKDRIIAEFQAEKERANKERTVRTTVDKFNTLFTTLSTNQEELGKAIEYYEKLTNITLFDENNLEFFNKVSPKVFESALKSYRKKLNPQIVVKPKQQEKKANEEETISEDIKKYFSDM